MPFPQLHWNKKLFSKTFHTADSGLPVCYFSSEYSCFSAFTSHLSKYYNDTVHWAFSLKVKDTELASSDDGDLVVMLDSEGGISFDMPVSIDNVISLHAHQTIATPKPSLLTTVVNSFHRVNTLYDGTVNCFSTLVQSSV